MHVALAIYIYGNLASELMPFLRGERTLLLLYSIGACLGRLSAVVVVVLAMEQVHVNSSHAFFHLLLLLLLLLLLGGPSPACCLLPPNDR